MNKWQVLLILDRIQRGSKPRGEWCLIALTLFLGFLFPLLTSDFKKTLSFEPAVWDAFCLIGSLASEVTFLIFSARWAFMKCTSREKSAEDILAGIIQQMQADTERINGAAIPSTDTARIP